MIWFTIGKYDNNLAWIVFAYCPIKTQHILRCTKAIINTCCAICRQVIYRIFQSLNALSIYCCESRFCLRRTSKRNDAYLIMIRILFISDCVNEIINSIFHRRHLVMSIK